MTVPLGSARMTFNIVPKAYISSTENRINFQELPAEKIQELMKTANIYEQELILQDLLIAGKPKETKQQKDMIALAAKLFILAPTDIQRDFLTHLLSFKAICKDFYTAMNLSQ